MLTNLSRVKYHSGRVEEDLELPGPHFRHATQKWGSSSVALILLWAQLVVRMVSPRLYTLLPHQSVFLSEVHLEKLSRQDES